MSLSENFLIITLLCRCYMLMTYLLLKKNISKISKLKKQLDESFIMKVIIFYFIYHESYHILFFCYCGVGINLAT